MNLSNALSGLKTGLNNIKGSSQASSLTTGTKNLFSALTGGSSPAGTALAGGAALGIKLVSTGIKGIGETVSKAVKNKQDANKKELADMEEKDKKTDGDGITTPLTKNWFKRFFTVWHKTTEDGSMYVLDENGKKQIYWGKIAATGGVVIVIGTVVYFAFRKPKGGRRSSKSSRGSRSRMRRY